MKLTKQLLIIAAWITLCPFAFSGNSIKIQESVEKMSQGYNNALTVEIPHTQAKEVEHGWKKMIKDYADKVTSSKGDIFADNALIKEMSDNTVDIYTRVEPMEGGTKLYVFFDLGGAYLSSSQHERQYKVAEKMIYEFAVRCAKEAVVNEIADAEKLLRKMEKEQERLIKENESLHKDIEKYKESIQKAEKGIEENLKNQEGKKTEIETQQKTLEAVKEKLNQIN